MAPFLSNGNGHVPSRGAVGVLTRTIIKSPVTNSILHARLRHKGLNDAVFVGSDFVHVRQLGQQGHLEHIATKDDFDAKIRAAAVFRVDNDLSADDFLVKEEDGLVSQAGAVPPDLLVLTLDTNDLVFIHLEAQCDGTFRFVQQSLPMPIFDRELFQPGAHLAADPHYRALAVAANEREVVIYAAKARDRVAQQIRDGDKDWCPVAAERALQVDGVIQHMDFLIPPDEDGDHVILLLIVVDRQRTKAVWIDWYNATGLHRAEMHPGAPLSSARTVSSLLIPLRNAAFLLVTGREIMKYRNILSGSITNVAFAPFEDDMSEGGSSPMQPFWASWCRPHRDVGLSRARDHIYLVREDGLVLYINAMVDGRVSNISAGHLKCHVGRAFASLGQITGPDILAVAGEMSGGCVVSIGLWPSTNGARVDSLGWQDTMEMELIQHLPNWASSTDILASSMPHIHSRLVPSKDGLFVTSGRQPHGAITELRLGIEARSWARVEIDDMHVVTSMWTVPMASNGALLFLMSTPSTTRVFELDTEPKIIEHDATALDTDHRTLAAGVISDGRIIQVTEHGVSETSSLVANFEDTARRRVTPGDRIIAAALNATQDILVTAEHRGNGYVLCFTKLISTSASASTSSAQPAAHAISIPSAALALAMLPMTGKSLAAVATAEDGTIIVIGNESTAHEVCRVTQPHAQHASGLCENLVLLRAETTNDLLLLCGLRDGFLFTAVLCGDDEGGMHACSTHTLRFGQSTVRIVAMADHPSQACVMAGPDTCLLTWDGESAASLSIDSVWFSDKAHPELGQGAVLACAQVPKSDYLAMDDFAGSFAMVSGNDLLLTHLESTPDVVPRQLSISGTPTRLLYAQQQKCLVVATSRTGVRAFPTPNAQPEQRRQIWPAIDFIPARASEPSFSHEMQPGERVFALLEWTYKQDEKTYSFVLVGGSYRRRNGNQGGRVTFLQPSLTGWEVTGVRADKVTRFEYPVHALALYDELTYVVCYGQNVCLYRFSKEKKWEELCQPLALNSLGVFVTVDAPLIYVSTNKDSLNTLQLRHEQDDDGNALWKLVLVASGPQADNGLSHVVVQPSHMDSKVALVTTMDRRLVGLSSRPSPTTNTVRPIADDLLFSAVLPRSLTRIRQASVRPPWKTPFPEGVMAGDITGIASDGSLVGVSLLNEDLWRRLSWLQRLCEWSKLLSPHGCEPFLYTAAEGGYTLDERPLPIGISATGGDESEIMLRTSIDAPADKHIDGDVLARLLEHGGADTLRQIIRETSIRDDHAGTWTREHLDEELGAVDEIVALLGALLERWL